MTKSINQIKPDDEVVIIDGVTITSNINEPGVREYVTKCICEMAKKFAEKYEGFPDKR